MMRIAVTLLLIAFASGTVFGQSPTLRVVTSDPNLPSELFYGNVKIKPLRVRPGTNPPQLITIDDSDFYVQQQYVDFLNRMPDASGFAFWNSNITNCGVNAACTEVARVNVSGAFYLSIEFQDTGYLVERLYKASYGDTSGTSTTGGSHQLGVPTVRFSEFVPDTKTIGQGVVVGQPGWPAALEANKVSFTNAFVQRSRFTDPTAFPTSMTPAQFVAKLNSNIGNLMTVQEQNAAIAEFGVAGDTSNTAARARALRDVAENATFSQNGGAEFQRAFVLMQYFGYLRRDPNSGPDTDYSGYEFWLGKLNQFNGNYINAEMVKAFISASEYRQRF
jgi:hypothetical protein